MDLGLRYTIELDRIDVGQIRPRQTRSFELPPGPHEIRLRFLPSREIHLSDRGEHELKGVPGSWRIFAVEG